MSFQINIPIYKRPDLLRKCLTKTFSTLPSDQSVQINLFDDSTDGTNDSVVEDLQAIYRNLHHIKNPINLGIDKNIDQAMRYGNALYTWLLGEDDFLLPGSYELIKPYLDKGEFSVVAVNYGFYKNDLSGFVKPSVIPVRETLALSAEELLALYGWAMGFIGACIIRQDIAKQSVSLPYHGPYFSHLGSIFSAAYGSDRCLVFAQPLVANRAENLSSFSWSGDAMQVYYGMERLFDMLSPPYTREIINRAKKSARPALPHRSWRGLIALRSVGLLNRQTLKKITSGAPMSLKLEAWILCVLPTQLFAMLRKLKRAVAPNR